MNRIVRFVMPVLLTVAGLHTDAARAQEWPSQQVTIAVPFGPGNAYDVMARYLADRLKDATGQPFIVEARQGAIGNIAAAWVARAPADGHTLFFSANSTHAANIHLFRKLPYDPVKDFEPVTTIATIPQVLLVSPTLPVNTLQELVAYAKQNPGKLNYGSSSATGRVATNAFRHAAGIEAAYIPYRTTSQALTDLISGQLHFMVVDAASGITHARGGRVKALAVTTKQRLASAPELPTMGESGLAGFEFTAWLALFVPANTPPEVVRRIADQANAVVRSQGMADTLSKLYAQPYPGSPESLRQLVKRDTVRWGEMIKAAGIEPE